MNKVLIIEDDPFFRKQMLKALQKRLDGYHYEWAVSYAEACTKLEAHSFELIISDLVLPDSDGEHITDLVGRGEKVIVVTGQEDSPSKERIRQLDIVDYLYKSDSDHFEYLSKLIERLRRNREKKILLVEDAKSQRRLIAHFLRGQNLEVLTASDGNEALHIIENTGVDLILSDYNMAPMDGLELLRTLRQKYSMLELPFIALSSSEEDETVAKFLKQGANDYLKKPFCKEELLCRINNVLDTFDMLAQIRTYAITDPLTGLFNRRYLHTVATKMVAGAQRYRMPFSAAMLDVDYFKRINDTYGHLVGDRVLKTIAALMKQILRSSDVSIRFGGEEFLILMPNTDERRAFVVAEKLRKSIAEYPFPLEDSRVLHVQISAGVARLKDGMTLEDLIERADEALYRAKEHGRNRVEMADEE